MCRNYIYWATEFLNYMSLVFWGLKLFVNKYEIRIGRKAWVENLIIILSSLPIVIFSVDNYKIVVYSNMVSHTLVVYMYTKTSHTDTVC